MSLKKGDNVIVIAGKDKGKKAKILKVISMHRGTKVILDGISQVKRRRKPRKAGEKGQVVTISMPVNASNVSKFCDTCGKGVRLEHKH